MERLLPLHRRQLWLQALCSSASPTFVNMSTRLQAASSHLSTNVGKDQRTAKWVLRSQVKGHADESGLSKPCDAAHPPSSALWLHPDCVKADCL